VSRYELPDPKCRHARHATRVTAGDPHDGPHASVWVCDRQACIDDAREWAAAYTRLPVEIVKEPQ
jgi:hypothetical protein